MSAALAGITVLIIGASQFAHDGYLISSLHDDLRQEGASVVTYGACASVPHSWLKPELIKCGSAIRVEGGKVEMQPVGMQMSYRVTDLIHKYHPQLVLIGIADTMADYKQMSLPVNWIHQETRDLVDAISAEHVACIWIGTSWGQEGGPFGKNFARVQQLSDVLTSSVAPCGYINSLKLSKPGEWATIDGQHHTTQAYALWGRALVSEIEASIITRSLIKPRS